MLLHLFYTSNSAVFVGRGAKIVLLPGVGTLATSLIQIELIEGRVQLRS